jgi:hypothetical protein
VDEPKRNRFVAFLDSQWLGIGVGVIAGAFGSLLSARWLIVFGWFLICLTNKNQVASSRLSPSYLFV